MNINQKIIIVTALLFLGVGYIGGNIFPWATSEPQNLPSKPLNSITCLNLSLSDAQQLVDDVPSVKDLIERNGDIILVRYDRSEADRMIFQIFERVLDTNSSHTATYDWISVDRCTGAVKSEL